MAGRPLLHNGVMRPRTVRMTDAQAEKFVRLGGVVWLRKKIEQAKDKGAK